MTTDQRVPETREERGLVGGGHDSSVATVGQTRGMLGADDPLPQRPKRILIAGVAGSGKTTLAGRISALAGIPHTEIDGLFHGPAWTPREAFLTDVDAFTSADRWVTEWQYRTVRPLLCERADTMVWLDFSRFVTVTRVVRRTWHRARTQEEMWNGNREPGMLYAIFRRDGIIRWSVSTHRRYARAVPEAQTDFPRLTIVRLRRPRDVESWFAGPLADAVRDT